VWTEVVSGAVHRAPRYWEGYWDNTHIFSDGFNSGDTVAWW